VHLDFDGDRTLANLFADTTKLPTNPGCLGFAVAKELAAQKGLQGSAVATEIAANE